MQQRIYHGNLKPLDFAQALVAHFHRGNMRVQQIGSGERIVVQIATSDHPAAGGHTALGVQLQRVADGVAIDVGQQAWAGVAASIGLTALQALRNPFSLLTRLDDLAQDYESITLTEEVWKIVDRTARATGTGFELSERLRRISCPYCQTANPVGEACCIACGGPLGNHQPDTCSNCGYVVKVDERFCPNCGQPVRKAKKQA